MRTEPAGGRKASHPQLVGETRACRAGAFRLTDPERASAMNRIAQSLIILFTSLGAAAVGGGAAMTYKLRGPAAGSDFLYAGGAWLMISLLVLIVLRQLSLRRAFAHPIFMAYAINVGLTSMVACLALAAILAQDLSSGTALSLVLGSIGLVALQLWRTYRHFNDCWRTHHEEALRVTYNVQSRSMWIKPWLKELHIARDLFFPRMLRPAKPIIAGALIISTVLGMNFQRAYPELSALAIAAPSIAAAAAFLQLSLVPFLLGLKIKALESRFGGPIALMADDEISRRERRN